jgi:hydroxymethylpyrimidine/phosphomethylpyrimidine kinase
MNLAQPAVLTISGFDPTGGAGVIADLKTFAANGCYGTAAITAFEMPHPSRQLHAVEPEVLRGCMTSALADTSVKAIKIGMLATGANAAVVLEALEANASLPAVFDPLVRSTSGQELIDAAGLEFVRERLLGVATVITPNLPEAAALTGLAVVDLEGMKAAAKRLIELGARAVVVTGGHLERPADVFADGATLQVLAGDRVKPENIYGAACTFSSALAANLAQGRRLEEAIVLAKAYVTEAIKKAYAVGPGRVPLNHFYRMQELASYTTTAVVKPVH